MDTTRSLGDPDHGFDYRWTRRLRGPALAISPYQHRMALMVKPRIRVAAPSVRITWTQYALNYMDPPAREMTDQERADLNVWLLHGRIGTGRGYQEEVARAYRIEAEKSR